MDSSLEAIIKDAGLKWEEAKTVLDTDEWRSETDTNREALFALGKWGVPTMTL